MDLAIILATYNERENVYPMLDCLAAALAGVSYEVVFVDDDSADGTAELVREISLQDPKIRLIHRVNRRGLASACIEGMMSTAAPYIAVMDADLQHDERILPAMLSRLREDNLDIVVGSRNTEGGSMGAFDKKRVALSRLGQRFSQAVCQCEISDPMSGFFILRREFLLEAVHRTSGMGFKILVDLLASSPRPVRLGELPYTFRTRLRGESKLDILVGIEYLQLLLDKLVGSLIPPSFILFALVGAVGVAVHFFFLGICLFAFHLSFASGQGVAAVAAMTVNFLVNNIVTYRDRRLRGKRLVTGLLSFYLACAVGLFINLELAGSLRNGGMPWYFAGFFGLALGSVWNYGVTRMLTWRTDRRVTRNRAAARRAANLSTRPAA